MSIVLRTASRVAPVLGPVAAARLFSRLAAIGSSRIPSTRALRENRRFFGLPGADGERDSAIVAHFGAYLGEFLGAAGRADRIRSITEGSDFAALDRAAATGRGLAVVTPHFGNWELGALALGLHRPGTAVLIRTTGDDVLDAAMRRARGDGTEIANRLLDVADGTAAVAECLQSCGVLAAAIDEPRDRGIPVRFLGRIVSFPSAFFRLVAEAGALVLPARCRRETPGRVRVEVFAAVTDASPQATAQAVADSFGAWIREDPDQWVMMRSFLAPGGPKSASAPPATNPGTGMDSGGGAAA